MLKIHSQDKASLDWVSRVIHASENRLQEGDADRDAVMAGLVKSGGWWLAGELLVLADNLGDSKISSIIDSMMNPRSRYAVVTINQRKVVADALLTCYGTAWCVYATAIGIKEEELKAARFA